MKTPIWNALENCYDPFIKKHLGKKDLDKKSGDNSENNTRYSDNGSFSSIEQ